MPAHDELRAHDAKIEIRRCRMGLRHFDIRVPALGDGVVAGRVPRIPALQPRTPKLQLNKPTYLERKDLKPQHHPLEQPCKLESEAGRNMGVLKPTSRQRKERKKESTEGLKGLGSHNLART